MKPHHHTVFTTEAEINPKNLWKNSWKFRTKQIIPVNKTVEPLTTTRTQTGEQERGTTCAPRLEERLARVQRLKEATKPRGRDSKTPLFAFIVLAALHGLWDVSFPMSDWTQMLSNESLESPEWSLSHQGMPHFLFLKRHCHVNFNILFIYLAVPRLSCGMQAF